MNSLTIEEAKELLVEVASEIKFDRDDLLDAIYNYTIVNDEYSNLPSEREYFYDACDMIKILESLGIKEISQRDVMTIWYYYSHTMDGSWLIPPYDFKTEKGAEYFLKVCNEFIERYRETIDE